MRYDVRFERERDGTIRRGKAPTEASSPSEAEESFLEDVEDAEGEFAVYDVELSR